MAAPHEKLASALAALAVLQRDGRRVFQSKEIGRTHRERLVRNGFLREVVKGWLISSSPNATEGETTPWYASFWEFCARYSRQRFATDWHLSPEQSLLLHADTPTIPTQVIIYSPKGTNNTLQLLFGTSLYDLKENDMPPSSDLTERNDLRLFSTPAALVRVPETFFQRSPAEAQVALASIKDASELLGRLLDGGHSAIAGRLAGAFRRVGRAAVADEIVKTMRQADYTVRETDPFTTQHPVQTIAPGISPIIGRLQVIWQAHRQTVIDLFPPASGLPRDQAAYLRFVDDIYKSDAYHSLSIEGYSVTPELIERVRQGSWNPDLDKADSQGRDALAARGYWQAFQLVKTTVAEIIAGAPPGSSVRTDHRAWYRELFQPSVAAGLLRAGALAGYRTGPVFLRGSRHVPPRAETIPDAMDTYFGLLEEEAEPAVRAVLGHWLFGYIHPYPDGNGRMARFLMNAMLASGGYPWTVIRVEDRDAYLTALESASVDGDSRPFSAFLAERLKWSREKFA